MAELYDTIRQRLKEKKMKETASMGYSESDVEQSYGKELDRMAQSYVEQQQKPKAPGLPPEEEKLAIAGVSKEPVKTPGLLSSLQEKAKPAIQKSGYDPNKDPELQKELIGQTEQRRREMEKEKSAAPVAAPVAPPKEEGKKKVDQLGSNIKAAKDISADLPEKDRKDFDSRYEELRKEYDQAIADYKKDRDNIRLGQIGEALSNAFTQLIAGAYGLKHGIDMSSIRGSKWDWKQEFDNVLEEARMKKEGIEKRRHTLEQQERLQSEEERADARLKYSEQQAMARERLAGQREAARMGAEERKYAEALAKEERASQRTATESKINDVQRVLGNDKAPELKSEEDLHAWASSVFGKSAADDIVAKAKKGEWWGMDKDKARSAISQYAAAMREKRDAPITGGAPAAGAGQYKDGDTRVVNGVTYKRQGGQWLPQK